MSEILKNMQTIIPDQEIQQEEVKTEVAETNKVNENYEALIKQQQEQINQLLKQQELNNKVQQQLNSQMNRMMKSDNMGGETKHWIDRELEAHFKFESEYDPQNQAREYLQNNTKQVALWWLQYQKDKGLSNEEIATKYKKMMQIVDTGIYPSEEIK